MIKCAIFDLDGTLVDSMEYWSKAPKKYVKKLGYECGDELVNKFLSMSLPESAKYMKDFFKLNLSIEKIMQGIDDVMEDAYLNHVELKPNMKYLLEELDKINVKMAIASATDVYLIKKVIKKLGIDKYFLNIQSTTEIGVSKKQSTVYDICRESFNAKENESIVFEDLPYGIISTSEKGYHTVGLYDEPSKIHQDKIKQYAEFYFVDFTKESADKIIEFCKK